MGIKHGWIGLAMVGLVLAGQGCQRTENASERKPRLSDSKILQPGYQADKTPAKLAKTGPQPPPAPVVTPPKPAIPPVALSAEQLATCLVKVGDRMPDAELPAPDGKPHSLASLRGQKLTVLFFWMADNPYSLGEVEDLNDLAKTYANRGVHVIGVNRGSDSPEKVREKIRELAVAFPVLMEDSANDYFAKVAKEKPLRTYLLDADGKILWFDVEYSRSTRRDLLQAIDAVL